MEEIIRLRRERDAALKLAEEAENNMNVARESAQKMMEEGYEEAYQMLVVEQNKARQFESDNAKLEGEVKILKEQNARLLASNGLAKGYVDQLDSEFKQRESDLYAEYEAKLKQQREFMVGKLDEFLRLKYESLEELVAMKAVEEAMSKGGEELLREVLGEDGVELHKASELKRKVEEEEVEKRTAEARRIRKEIETKKAVQATAGRMKKQVKQGTSRPAKSVMAGYASGGKLANKFGNPYYGTISIGPTIEEKVKSMADKENGGTDSESAGPAAESVSETQAKP